MVGLEILGLFRQKIIKRFGNLLNDVIDVLYLLLMTI